MWQRIQTVYLLLAAIAMIACLCLPIGEIVPEKLGVNSTVTNIFVSTPDQGFSFISIPLFGLLGCAAVLALFTIVKFHKRKLQAKCCVWASTLCVLWYAALAIVLYSLANAENAHGDLVVNYSASLPLIAIILLWMARRSILKDEALVRAADRIR